MEIYNLLGLDKLECSVALIKNVNSKKMGKKDIIKIDSDYNIDMDILGYVDPDVTVNIIKNGVKTDKRTIALPERLTNVLYCKNPRCITATEQELPQIFKLTDRKNKIYRCIYCETKAN
jgi:aspartate carbamoyltransferase regulatory subunit